MGDENMYVEMLREDESLNYIEDLREVITLLDNNELTKDHLKDIVLSYDVYSLYHMLFELFGCVMDKNEYIELKKRYVQIFDLDIVPLPECCFELDEKWGVKNV